MRVRSGGREEHPPGGGQGNPPQYSCLENPHGQRRLAGCSPWGSPRLGHTEIPSLAMARPQAGTTGRIWESSLSKGPEHRGLPEQLRLPSCPTWASRL